jgi:cytochrome c oxidase assembly factor CtaG
MLGAVEEIFTDWTVPVWLTGSILIAAAIYLRGWLALRKTRRKQFNEARLVSFVSGLAVLWLAIGSPMDGFADALLSAHMVEHLLLMSVVPPLLLWGLPVVPLLRGMPAWLTRNIVGVFIRNRTIRQFAHWLVTPIVAWLAMNVTLLAWHIPGAYDFALEHENWHAAEHACFLFTSLLFWWCVIRPWPAEKSRNWGVLLYLVTADIVNTLLSAFLAFCGRPVYTFYVTNPNPFHVSPSDDQILGAVIMWVFGSIIFLVPAMLITLQLAGMNQHRQDHGAFNRPRNGTPEIREKL